MTRSVPILPTQVVRPTAGFVSVAMTAVEALVATVSNLDTATPFDSVVRV